MRYFGMCHTKAAARRASIIEPWRTLSGLEHIPGDRVYVTLCGPLADVAGTLQSLCEPVHMAAEGLIRLDQCHGIERRPEIHQANVAAVIRDLPMGDRPHLHEGELTDVLSDFLSSRILRPAIVNIDLFDGPRQGLSTLARVLSILNGFTPPMLVVWNVVAARTWPSRNDLRSEFARLSTHGALNSAIERGAWRWHGHFEYHGTGRRSQTTMRSYILWRSA